MVVQGVLGRALIVHLHRARRDTTHMTTLRSHLSPEQGSACVWSAPVGVGEGGARGALLTRGRKSLPSRYAVSLAGSCQPHNSVNQSAVSGRGPQHGCCQGELPTHLEIVLEGQMDAHKVEEVVRIAERKQAWVREGSNTKGTGSAGSNTLCMCTAHDPRTRHLRYARLKQRAHEGDDLDLQRAVEHAVLHRNIEGGPYKRQRDG